MTYSTTDVNALISAIRSAKRFQMRVVTNNEIFDKNYTMIDESQNIYYICYAILCGLLGIAYLRFQSTQSQHTLVTTKEFKQFQTTFLVGYSTITLCELIANGNYFNLCHILLI